MRQKFKIIDVATRDEYGTIIKEEFESNWVWSKAVYKIAITNLDITDILNNLIEKNKLNCKIKVFQSSKHDSSIYKIVFKNVVKKTELFTITGEYEVEYKKEKGKRFLCLSGGDEELYIDSKTLIGKEFIKSLA
jgi:Zn-finger domain-containing protein